MKCCITILVHKNYIKKIQNILDNLNEFFSPNNPNIDIIFFLEKNYVENIPTNLNYTGGKIIFYHLDNFEHKNLKNYDQIPERVFWFDIGYRMMCKFFAGDIFRILKNLGYDYSLRLDTDSKFYTPIRNIFEEFINLNMDYGYISIYNECNELCVNLSCEIKKYIFDNSLNFNKNAIIDNLLDTNLAYYNNFEMLKIETFSSEHHLNLFDYLNRISDGFIKYRWGDSLFRFKYVQLFIPNNKVHYFGNLSYFHKSDLKNKPFILHDWNFNKLFEELV
jgi:hypothetical protein